MRSRDGGDWVFTVNPTRALALTLAVTGLGMFPLWLLGALAPQLQQELNFGAAALGVVVATFQGVAAITSVPAGIFVERRGWNTGALFTILLYLAATGGIAFLTGSYAWLVIWMVLAGIASGLASPTANLGLVTAIGPRRRALAFGIKQSASPGASMLAGLSIPFLAVRFGWQMVFAMAALAAVPVLALRAQRRRAPSAVRRDKVIIPRPSPAGPVLLMSTAGGLASAATSSMGGFYVTSAIAGGASPSTAGFLLSAGAGFSIVVRIHTGWRASKRVGGHLVVVTAMMAIGGLATVALGWSNHLVILLPATLLAFGAGWGWNGLFDYTLVDRIADAPATATGVAQTGKNLGGLFGPVAFGFLAEYLSFRIAWLAVGSSLVVAAIAVLVTRWWVLRLRAETGGAGAPDRRRRADNPSTPPHPNAIDCDAEDTAHLDTAGASDQVDD